MKIKRLPRFVARKLVHRLSVGFFCAVAVAGLLAQQPFDHSLERQLWKTLLPMGGDLASAGPNFVPIPRRVSVNTPSSVSATPSYVDEFGTTIYKSLTDPWLEPGDEAQRAASAYVKERDLLMAATLADPVGHLHTNDGECTYSQLDDYDNAGPQWRQCKLGLNMIPPPPGALFDPVGIATDGATVYVVDDFNHRVQAFDFEGRVKPMQFPIGNGVPGVGPYTYNSLTPAYRPYAGFPGFETFDGGYSGEMLNAPNGLAVDAAHQIVIADSGNHRVVAFNGSGVKQLEFALPDHLGLPTKPTLVAVTPGATVLPEGSPIPAGHESDRIVVTDWSHCTVQIFKSNFELVKALPEALPEIAMHDACLSPGDTEDPDNPPRASMAGEFSTVTGATIDAGGRIYITDHAQNVVQVLDQDGGTLGWIGRPGEQAAPGELSGPVGVSFDHLGRIGVIDGGNSRVVFYSLTFDPDTGAPASTFEFQLDVTVSVSDFPMGLAEQVGSGPGLDPKGRFLATDPYNRRILRFELPELGIADAVAPFLATPPPGTPDGTVVGHGTFKVLVPSQKEGAVKKVEVTVAPVEPGIALVAGSLKPLDPALAGPPQVLPDIDPGQYVEYEFFYTAPESIQKVTFRIDAKGDFDSATGLYKASAPQAEAKSTVQCALCDARHEVWWLDQAATPGMAAPIHNATTGDWYPDRVVARLKPNPIDADVTAIGWYYEGAASIFYPQHGVVQETAIGPDGYVEVPFGVEGASRLYYWAISSEGAVGDTHTVDLNVDLTPPSGTFVLWPPYTGTTDPDGRNWYNHPISASYNVVDTQSGTDADVSVPLNVADGTAPFTNEGRDQVVQVNVEDRVHHTTTLMSATGAGGQYVNIDMTAPTFDTVPVNPIVLAVTGSDALGGYSVVHPDAFKLAATDPALTNGEPGSGVASITNPGGQTFRAGADNHWTYTVTDHAGNSRSVTVDVIVLQGDSEIGAPELTVGYGSRLILRAAVTPRTATGTVTFSFGPHTIVAPIQTVGGLIDPATGAVTVAGEAVAALDPVLDNVNTYPLTVSYSGDSQNNPVSSGLGKVHVLPRAVTITAHPKSKYFGDVDPTLTSTVTGLIGTDTAIVSLVRAPGTAVGIYPIQLAGVTISGNYSTVYQPADMTIIGKVTVTAAAKTAIYGAAETPYAFTLSPLPAGGVVTTQPSCGVSVTHVNVGTYPIQCAGAAGNFLEFSYAPASLRIDPRPAQIVANPKSRPYGVANPALDAVVTGTVNGDTLNYSLSTTATLLSAIGGYPITVTPGVNANYDVAVTGSTLTINLGAVTIAAVNTTKVYGNANPALTATIAGLPVGATLDYTLSTTATVASPVGTYPISVAVGPHPNFDVTVTAGTLSVTPRLITVAADAKTKVAGTADPALTYRITSGSLYAATDLTGSLARGAGEAVGVYPITQGSLTGSGNYAITFIGANFTITAANTAPDAVNDAASTIGAAPVTIAVLSNDLDVNGDTLSIASFTQPATGGTVTSSGNLLVFTPAVGFVGTTTFTYTLSDGHGGTDVATVTITVTAPPTCTLTGFTTYTQGGWGAKPNGNNPAKLLQTNFARVYPDGYVRIGGNKTLTFTSSTAIGNFLAAGGSPGVLTSSASNPTSSSAGVFAGQVLAMQLNLDFSEAGVTKPGLGDLVYQGYSVRDIVAAANAVLGGDTSILAGFGLSVSDVNDIIDSLNQNFDNGTQNLGVLSCPPGATNCGVTQVSTIGNSALYGTAGNIRTFSGGGVSIKASAFSRAKSNGAWATAYLGAFGVGLGVTDGSEGTGLNDTHKIDNIGDRVNYVMFEFSQPVVVTRAFLDYIGADGDITVWLGNKAGAYENHQTLSDAFLASLGAPKSDSSNSTADRWASFNGGAVTANVLVIAADINDSTPDDAFKIAKLEFRCASVPNRPPTVTATNTTSTEGDAISMQISASDEDGDDLTFVATGLPPGLTINASTGLITGTLGYSAAGTYHVTIRVDDDAEGSGTAAFDWVVANKNRPPTVAPANRSDNKLATASGSVSGTDPDGDAMTYTATGLPPGVSMSTAGIFSGTLTTVGTYTVTITVKDTSNATGTGTFVWTVVAPNSAPTISASNRTSTEGDVVSVQFTGSDPDGDALTFSATGLPSGLSISSTGKVTGTLGSSSAGTYTVTITVKDPGNKTGSATFVWTVNNCNRAPDAKADSASVFKGDSVTIGVLGNDTDPDGDALSIKSVTTPSKGSVSIQGGSIKYTAPSNWTGTTSFSYTVKDASGLTDTATVTVTVKAHYSGDGCSNHR